MFHQRELKKIGGLEGIEIQGRPEGLCVILFHGYGADCFDLASLSDVSGIPCELHWVFPQGILQVPIGPNYTGRAWFPIDVAKLEAALRSGDDLNRRRPPGLDRARDLALAMIDQLPFPRSRIVVGGFSQGAMLATELAIHSEEAFAGLVILSGTLLDEDNWLKRASKRPGFAFFQSHGIRDSVLPVEAARRLSGVLEKAGWSGHLYEFKGQHEIPYPVIQQMGSYLQDRAKASRL